MNFENPTATHEQEPKYPTIEEIKARIRSYIDREHLEITSTRTREDQKGVYFHEDVLAMNKDGKTAIYLYRRSGDYNETKSSATCIEVVWFRGNPDNGDWLTGDTLCSYDEATGKWREGK